MCNSFNKKFLDEAAKHWSGSEDQSDGRVNGFMKDAIQLALRGMDNNDGGPFGCVVVKDGKIIGRGNNRVTSGHDPTAHAEILAIREACAHLGSHQLEGCVIYTSCEPCPMCLGAIFWARISKLYYGCSRADAAAVGFSDRTIYEAILAQDPSICGLEVISFGRNACLPLMEFWDQKDDKVRY